VDPQEVDGLARKIDEAIFSLRQLEIG